MIKKIWYALYLKTKSTESKCKNLLINENEMLLAFNGELNVDYHCIK